MLKEFSNAVCERIGYYVYFLKDPRDDNIFYVGKGNGNRIFQHVLCALETSDKSDKLDLIREIGSENVQHYILRHSLTENEAFEIESTCIDILGLNTLTNIVKGHDSWERGIKSADEVIQHFDAAEITITEPSIIININMLYRRFMSPEELYNATRCCWKIGQRRNQAKYAIAAYRGLVREVYSIESWEPNEKRWGFIGRLAEDKIRAKYLNQSLKKYMVKGSQNPIKYTF